MLTYFPPNVQPDIEALRNGTIPNNDGHGYAIVIPGRKPRILVRHNMSPSVILKKFARDRKRYPNGPALFHSRWTTGGLVTEFNCHPFKVNRDKRTVVAHNGVLPSHMHPPKNDGRSDTRFSADTLFAPYLRTDVGREHLGRIIGKNNKLVFLTVDPAIQGNAFIINEDSGNWDDSTGIWYSNYDYVGYKALTSAYDWRADTCTTGGYSHMKTVTPNALYAPIALGTGEWYTADDTCPHCAAKGEIDVESQVCMVCYTCLDCDEDSSKCFCYLPQYANAEIARRLRERQDEQDSDADAAYIQYLEQERRKHEQEEIERANWTRTFAWEDWD